MSFLQQLAAMLSLYTSSLRKLAHRINVYHWFTEHWEQNSPKDMCFSANWFEKELCTLILGVLKRL